MRIDNLQPGDIIFIRKGLYDYSHIGICMEAGGTFETTRMAHTVGKMQPYSLVLTHLAPKDILEKNGVHYDVVRPGANTRMAAALNIIEVWLKHLIPFDPIKYHKMVSLAPHIDIIGSEGSLGSYTEAERAAFIDLALEQQRELYENNKYTLVSLAATRNIGPTPPLPVTVDSVDGIICTSPIIMSFQIAGLAEHVATVTNFWVSDRQVAFDELDLLLDYSKPTHIKYHECMKRIQTEKGLAGPDTKFHSALRLLKTPLEDIDFDQIPVGMRLDPILCSVSALYYSLSRDDNNFTSMGELEIPECSHANELHSLFEKNVAELIKKGNETREMLYKQINYLSAYALYSRTFGSLKEEILGQRLHSH